MVSLPSSRLLGVAENTVIVLKSPWSLLRCDREGYRDLTTLPVEGGRLVNLGRSSGRDWEPALKLIPCHVWLAANYRLR